MRRGHWLLLMALLGLGAWLWLRSGKVASYINFPPKATGDWVAFGDSLTQGYGANEGADYPTQLAKSLRVRIRNLGVSGHTTADGLARLDQATQLQPRVVLLCLGGNDSLRGVPAEQTFANLGTMIDRFHATGSFVVLLGVRSVGLSDQNAKRFEQLAKTKRVLLVPNILNGILFNPKLMSDEIHPNDQGYARIVERVEEVLLPLLPKL
ncbi:MAG: arylesterase [Verrucomicrobia bacterium]|nr:arylesterase [Verrucomicrobiota bacterium]NBU09961.1 arylesterase [Pseudomonadota bacterium]NDA66144.1 arylesterase [Verrucomicrobiota bacterium]NDB78003.1 arylesterase [Verrucomicrobiota bacterium]NDD38068.1 arylesterase [Verrucomicrobiota bacterium]